MSTIEGVLIEPPTYGELEAEVLLLGAELYTAKMRHLNLLQAKVDAEAGLDRCEESGDGAQWAAFLLAYHEAEDLSETARIERNRAFSVWSGAYSRLRAARKSR
jgi:hypothetical protein